VRSLTARRAGRTVARLHAELPEIGLLSNKAIAKLAGLAPIANDSGKRKGKRSTRRGRAGVRSILFLVAAIVGDIQPRHRRSAVASPLRTKAFSVPISKPCAMKMDTVLPSGAGQHT
jgi:transposase